MMTQDEFLEWLWKEVIRSGADGKWIDSIVKSAAKSRIPGERRMGVLLKGLIDKGVSRAEIVELLEFDRRDTVFTIIHRIEDEGVEDEAWDGIHEEFETADPGAGDEPGAKPSARGAGAAAGGTGAQPAPLLTLKQSHHVAFSPDGRRVVTASGGRIWGIAGGKELARCELPPHTSSVAWSPGGNVIATQSTSGAIRLCDAKTGKKIAQVKMAGEGTSMDFTPDGTVLAAGDWGGNLFAWNAADGKLLNKREVGGMIHFVRTSRNEIAVIAGEDAIGLDPALKAERWRKRIGDLDPSCLHPSGKARAFIGWDANQLVKLSLDTGKKMARVKLKVEEGKHPKSTVVSPDGRRVCAVHGNQFILLDDSLRELGRRWIEYAHAATFSPDSQLIALASWGKGEIWRLDAFPREPTNKSK